MKLISLGCSTYFTRITFWETPVYTLNDLNGVLNYSEAT
jgi:hypothetical protein